MHFERLRKGRVRNWGLREQEQKTVPLVPAQSVPEVLSLAAPPDVDPGGKWAPGKAPDRHDTTQTPAAPPDRCAGRFPAGREAGTGAAPQAGLRRELLRVAVD